MTCVAVIGSSSLVRPAAAAIALRLVPRGAAGLVRLVPVAEMGTQPPGGETQERGEGERHNRYSRESGISPPPVPAAARLGAQLRSHGHPGRAAWRLVTSTVSAEDEARRVLSVLSSNLDYSVLCVEGSLTDLSLEVLADCDAGVVALAAGVPDGLGSLAVDCFKGCGCPTTVQRFDPPGFASVLPLAGIAPPPVWADPINAFVEWIGLAK